MSERERPQQGSRLPGWWTLARDIGSFLAGWILIFTEVQRADLRETVLITGATIVGIPAAEVARDALTRRSGTGGSSSSPPEAAPSQPQHTP